ncbi:MAG: CinA family protein [Lachnospiraceae bacterium]|nr:CinA family protein [Lachnospiraceae bacterium]
MSIIADMKKGLGSLISPSKDKLAHALFDELKRRHLRVSTAESCTGGRLADSLVSVEGISEVYPGGFVTYSDEAKARDLSVSRTALTRHTAVSSEVSRQMAMGLHIKTGADLCLTTTGMAGPTGGSPSCPVGTVYISAYYKGRVLTRHFVFKGNREAVRNQAVKEALLMGLAELEEG